MNNSETNEIVELPIDDRPVIIILNDKPHIYYIGRFIEKENIFMLSLDDESSDFVFTSSVYKWWYLNEHPTIIREIFPLKK